MAPITKLNNDASQASAGTGHAPGHAKRVVSQREVEDAVRTLIAWAGDDPDREALHGTPMRVAEAYQEYFRGYREDALAWLSDADIDMARGYDDIIMLRGVSLQSFCEHHMTPFEGKAHVAYLPDQKVVGLSRLARVVDTLAKRLQTQEALTEQIAATIESGLAPRGVAVLIEAEHQCMSLRGVRQSGVAAITHRFTGEFRSDAGLRGRFMTLVTG
ncbi:MAG: GTP cyclohydrolase I FolE [Planctomycetales bacterium]|nr:GTP cyclohydrolase I FolE [Planctomycetales bacterium]